MSSPSGFWWSSYEISSIFMFHVFFIYCGIYSLHFCKVEVKLVLLFCCTCYCGQDIWEQGNFLVGLTFEKLLLTECEFFSPPDSKFLKTALCARGYRKRRPRCCFLPVSQDNLVRISCNVEMKMCCE